MTPTEQDKELRIEIARKVYPKPTPSEIMICGTPEAVIDEVYSEAPIVYEFARYITADRKRVALEEWDIANEAVLKNAHMITDEQERLENLVQVDPKSYNDKIGSYMDKAFGFDLAFQPFAEVRRKRIAELKAQQEEV